MSTYVDHEIGEDTRDVAALLAKVREKFWWVVASTVAFAAVFALYAFLQTPIYRATTILMPASDANASAISTSLGQIGELAALGALGIPRSGAEAQAAMAVLKSREFTESFLRDRSLLPKLFPEDWDSERKAWRVAPSEEPSLVAGYERFDTKVRSIISDRRTGLVTLHVDWPDSQEAAELANELVRRLNEEMRSRAIRNANAAMMYLEEESAKTSTVVTQEAISRLMEAEFKKRMMANVTQEYAFQVVDKALPADVRKPIRPKRAFLIAFGTLLGCATGIVLALLPSRRAVGVVKTGSVR